MHSRQPMCSTEISTELSVPGALSAFPATLQHRDRTKTGKPSFCSYKLRRGRGAKRSHQSKTSMDGCMCTHIRMCRCTHTLSAFELLQSNVKGTGCVNQSWMMYLAVFLMCCYSQQVSCMLMSKQQVLLENSILHSQAMSYLTQPAMSLCS